MCFRPDVHFVQCPGPISVDGGSNYTEEEAKFCVQLPRRCVTDNDTTRCSAAAAASAAARQKIVVVGGLRRRRCRLVWQRTRPFDGRPVRVTQSAIAMIDLVHTPPFSMSVSDAPLHKKRRFDSIDLGSTALNFTQALAILDPILKNRVVVSLNSCNRTLKQILRTPKPKHVSIIYTSLFTDRGRI